MIVRYTNPNRIRDQILKCIELLGAEYSAIDYIIDVYKTKERLVKERSESPDMRPEQYEQILNGNIHPPGITIEELHTIKIFYFNLGDENRDIFLVFNLFHEIRHAWQNVNGHFHDEPGIPSIDDALEEYKNSPSEKDANQFAAEKVIENKNAIKKIFKLPPKIDFSLNLKW